MTLRIDQSLATAFITTPFSEGWLPNEDVEFRSHLRAEDVGPADIALISVAEATKLTKSAVLESSVAVVFDGVSPIAMRTSVRPDGVEEAAVRFLDAGATAELATLALIRSYFGIMATTFARTDQDEGAADAQIVVLDGLASLGEPESGHQEDLAKAWFVLTGQALVSHVTVVGVEAQVRGADGDIAALAGAVKLGIERRRDVRRAIADAAGVEIDRDRLADVTNRWRFALTPDDRQSAANLVARGAWTGRYGRTLPAYRDTLPTDLTRAIDEDA